jgi:inhibitor of KinA sporulation pathway (predicted exonuclease)
MKKLPNLSICYRQEIIEFPAVLLNCQKGEVEDEFRSYCRPVLNPLLTEFCTELTGITQVFTIALQKIFLYPKFLP